MGHQTDFAITDFVADVRAPTPSAAAELITPTRDELNQALTTHLARLQRHLRAELRFLTQALTGLDRRLLHPASQIQQKAQLVDELDGRLRRAWQVAAQRRQDSLTGSSRSLALLDPARRIREHRRTLGIQAGRLRQQMTQGMARRQLALAGSARALAAVSPLATLERGYAVLTQALPDTPRRTLTSVRDAAPGDRLRALLADGSLGLTVTDVEDQPPLTLPDTGASKPT